MNDAVGLPAARRRFYRPGRYYKDGSRPYHARTFCAGTPCPWHAPSRHIMRQFPRRIRFDRDGLVERICVHGVGHPDPDSVTFLRARRLRDCRHDGAYGVHGCDGCCRPWEQAVR